MQAWTELLPVFVVRWLAVVAALSLPTEHTQAPPHR